jgi:cellobiose-specific phosphotransferase system component IIC
MEYKAKAIGAMNDIAMGLTTFLAFGPGRLLADAAGGTGGDGAASEGCDLTTMQINNDGTLNSKCESGNMVETANSVLGKERTMISIITAIAAGIMIIFFIIKAVQLGKSGDNPSERSRAIGALIILFIAIALLGGISIFSGLAYNMFHTTG